MTKTITTYKTCKKCQGAGTIGCYSHVSGGRCFRCGGAGKLPAGTKTVTVKEAPAPEPFDMEKVMKECAEFDYSTLVD